MSTNTAARLVAILSLLLPAIGWSCGGYGPPLEDVLSDDPQVVELAINELRELGPRGFNRLLSYRERLEKAQVAETEVPAQVAKLARLDEAIDRVGGAKYCRASRLYWYTDLEQAKAAAAASGKPILALRMMGNLTDEFSCANSRFFRTTLYANEAISKTLRENFILTWKSVRPVPKVTIDFGDGRTLERTLTGNSIHYVLTPDGEVVEALPGLYGPAAFLKQIQKAGELAKELAAKTPKERSELLANHHRSALNELITNWSADLSRLRGADVQPTAAAAEQSPANLPATVRAKAPPTAAAATAIARPKARVEMPMLAAMSWRAVAPDENVSDELWEQIAKLHQTDATLDVASRQLIATQTPTAAQAGRLAITKRVVEDPLVRLVRNLQHSIAVDTLRNEYVLHRQLHNWLSEQPDLGANVDVLNERVYAELFLTPSSDPWLGLVPPDVYTALPNNGVK